ncbi:MAG: trypsin-like peptidase domain-containing protein, partial [Phycisphaerae bacterium]|nr:trypsin-like peptidase domain-containing protein [Phycisphaerae bacterium]
MNRALRVAGGVCAGIVAAACLAAWSPQVQPEAPPAKAITAPTFLGVDRFDEPKELAELVALEAQVKDVSARVRPSVVLLRARGGRGGVSTGTGVIIGKDGLVATCGHVGQRPGRSVEAVLSDGTSLHGTTLGQIFDRGVDCGLIQLDTKGRELPAAPLGSTIGLAKGDWILAFGHTHGSSSQPRPALLRVGRVLGVAPHELLLDAPIDAGDSGGPSFNLRGEVVGLNSRCGRPSWENVATPIDDLIERMDELRAQESGEQDARSSRRRTRPTNFPSGATDSGKLAVQRVFRTEPMLQDAQQSLVRVLENGKPLAYGTAVDGRGLAITKASQIAGASALEVESNARARFSARVVARDAESDVALLLIEGVSKGDLTPVEWATDVPIVPGTALVTPRVKPDQAAQSFGRTQGLVVHGQQDVPHANTRGVSARAADDLLHFDAVLLTQVTQPLRAGNGRAQSDVGPARLVDLALAPLD